MGKCNLSIFGCEKSVKYNRNIPLLMIHAFLSGCWFFIPILYIFLKEKGFSFTEIGLIASCKIGSKFFLEIPAGLFSDRFGPKKALIVSALAFGVSFFMVGASDSFFLMIIASLFNGIGQSFLSSSDSTIVYETLSQQGNKEHFSYVMGKKNSLNFLGFSLSAFGASLIIPYGLQWTFYVSSIFLLTSTVILFFLTEVKARSKDFNTLHHLIGSFQFIRENLNLRTILFYIVFFDIAIQLFFHYQQFLFKEIGVEDKYLGYVYGVAVLFSLAASKYSHLLKKRYTTPILLLGLALLMGLALLGAGFSKMILFTVLGIIIFQMSLGFSKTLLIDIFQSLNHSDKRATIFACKKSLYSLIFLICTPIYGMIADIYGIRMAISALILFVILNLVLLFSSSKQQKVAPSQLS